MMSNKMAGRKKQEGEERPGWGGLRDNAGRPKAEKPKRPIAVTLDDDEIGIAHELGNGNVSAGVRIALARAAEG